MHYSYLGKFPAVCGVDMTIREGEKIAIIGANGTGKSTLLHLLDGLIFPDKGQLKAFGIPLTEDFINNTESPVILGARWDWFFRTRTFNCFVRPSGKTLSLAPYN